MTEKIPQSVILDLLPSYLANEVSEETRSLIEEYLAHDPQLATLAETAKNAPSLQEIPAPLKKEAEMESFEKSKKLMVQHNVFLTLAVLSTLAGPVIMISTWQGLAMLLFSPIAAIFWIAFIKVNKKIG
ncbi:MAG: hypothetical protein MUO77_15340 [Anaerolineales bacterium]|nr:hypothetical protein [Anaerolineales bacterium]